MKAVQTCKVKQPEKALQDDLRHTQGLIIKQLTKITELQSQIDETETALRQAFKKEKQIIMHLKDYL